MSLTADSSLPSGRRDIPKDGEDEEEPIVTRQNEREWHIGCQEIAQRRRDLNQNCVAYHYCCARTPPLSWFLMASVTRMRVPISSSSAPTVIFIHRLRSSHKIGMR